jgi:predicted O-methyltransferase YrrM
MVPVSDEAIFEPDVLLARQQREKQSLERFHEDMRCITSLAEFNDWLHMTHLCYAVPRQSEFGTSTGLSATALASY